MSDLNVLNADNTLRTLAQKYGSDKAGGPSCPAYERYLGGLRRTAINFLEIGVGGYDDPKAGGASVRMWKEYFAQGNIYAIDLYDKSFHEEHRIKIYRGSQDDRAFLKSVAQEIGRLDVILDDGSHVSSHIIITFEVLFPLLMPGGVYIVEDVATSYFEDYGGSHDLSATHTAMAYFKRLADGINYEHYRMPYSPTYYDINTEFVHFYRNFIVIQKKPV